MITLSDSTLKDSNLDEIDLKILGYLMNDGRMPFYDIAKEIGISSVTVKNRLKGMFKGGAIRQISAMIDPKRLGYKICTFLNIILHSNKFIPKIVGFLEKIEGVFQLFVLSGSIQIKLLLYTKDMDEFSIIFAKISQIEEVKEVNSETVLNDSTMGKFVIS